jgi:hypothetical protein
MTQFGLSGPVTFGKGSPKWTIPSSRHDDTPVIPLPGPGAYDVPDNLDATHRVPYVFPRTHRRPVEISPTANVDFVLTPVFPRARPFHIGIREDTKITQIIHTPGPDYVPVDRDTRLPHKILSRPSASRSSSDSGDLGPGSYNPQLCYLTREPAFYFSGPKKRSDWMIDKQGIPGPGAYNTTLKEALARVPVWTIGRRSRKKLEPGADPTKPKDLLAVDSIIVDLQLLPNPAGARQYAAQHPELRTIVHEMIELVCAKKDDDPIGAIEDYWEELRELIVG